MRNCIHNILLELLALIGAWFGFAGFCNSFNSSRIFQGIGMLLIMIIYFAMMLIKKED